MITPATLTAIVADVLAMELPRHSGLAGAAVSIAPVGDQALAIEVAGQPFILTCGEVR